MGGGVWGGGGGGGGGGCWEGGHTSPGVGVCLTGKFIPKIFTEVNTMVPNDPNMGNFRRKTTKMCTSAITRPQSTLKKQHYARCLDSCEHIFSVE